MKIAVTGASGFVGSALTPFLTGGGHQVFPIRRSADWDPENGTINRLALEGMDAVVHLAGENIAQGRWTAAKKARIRDSRVKGTKFLSESLLKLKRPPQVLVSASAIGYYGDRGDEVLREESPAGTGFLPEVCRQWEGATDPATRGGIRVVHLRTGIVLSGKGGALGQMLVPFKLGVGGTIGSGKQYWSWISIDDLCGVFLHSIQAAGLHGPVNAVSPTPVTNLAFTKTLGRVLSRPTVFPIPALAARIVFGEMANELLLASARVEPAKLLSSRFVFRHKELEATLRYLLEL